MDGSYVGAAVSSVMNMCRVLQDQMKRIEQRLVVVEKKEDKLFDTLKEIGNLMEKLKKDFFSIKCSPFEVCK